MSVNLFSEKYSIDSLKTQEERDYGSNILKKIQENPKNIALETIFKPPENKKSLTVDSVKYILDNISDKNRFNKVKKHYLNGIFI